MCIPKQHINSKLIARGKRLRKEVNAENRALQQRQKNANANSWRPKPAPKAKGSSSSWKGQLADLIGAGVSGVGAAVGQPLIGGAVGAGVSAGLRAIWGSGAYHVASNTVMSGDANLTFKRTSQGMRVTNREYVTMIRSGSTLVSGATEFDNVSQVINPANAALFPWLSGVTTNRFVKYRFHGLVFEYVPTSGASVASTNTALGTIAGAVNPDPNDDAWTSMTELLHAENAISSVPANSVVWPVECASRDQVTNIRFVSNYSPDGEVDPRLVSPGTFQVATQGQQAIDVELGQLWVTYDVELFDPILEGGTLGCEGIYNADGSPTRILESGTTPVVLTVSQNYIPEGNTLTFNAPFEGIVLLQLTALASAIAPAIASNRPTTFQYTEFSNVFELAATAQNIAYFMKAESGTVIVFSGVVAPPTFQTRVYFSPFPYGSQYWPLVFGPRTHNRALRAMPRREIQAFPDYSEPLEDEYVPDSDRSVTRPPSPTPSKASSSRSKSGFILA